MPDSAARFVVEGHGLDDEHRDVTARRLKLEFDALGVESVRPVCQRIATGAKGDALEVGVLVVSLLGSRGLVKGVAVAVTSWLHRQPRDVELVINGCRFKGPVTRHQQADIIRALLGSGDLDRRASSRSENEDDAQSENEENGAATSRFDDVNPTGGYGTSTHGTSS